MQDYKSIYHPLHHFNSIIPTLFARNMSYKDQWKLLWWVIRIMRVSSPEKLFKLPDISSDHYLRELGISNSLLRQFLMPFFKGVLLDEDLQTSCRLLVYYLYFFIRIHLYSVT